MSYTEEEVLFLLGAYSGALIKGGLVDGSKVLELLNITNEFWKQYREIDKLPNQEIIKMLTQQRDES